MCIERLIIAHAEVNVISPIDSPTATNARQDLPSALQKTAQSFSALTQNVASAIKAAAAKTGVDFSYLLGKAAQESGFDATAKAATSSATGLYQFTNQTWLRMIKSCGAKHGLGIYADRITQGSDGGMKVENPAIRQAILDLRNDPKVSALMAAELDKENLGILQSNYGGKIGATELYLAHFLGANGATAFLNQMKSAPDSSAANALGEAAKANSSVFYDGNGRAKSFAEIYKHFDKKFNETNMAALAANAHALEDAPRQASHKTPTFQAYAPPALASLSGSPSAVKDIANLSTALSQTSGLPTTVTGGLRSGASSLFTTMVLAQMGMDGATSAALMGAKASHDGRKNNVWGNPVALS